MWLLRLLSLELWVAVGVILPMFLLLRRWIKARKKAHSNSSCDQDQQMIIAGIIAEALPVHPSSGWSLEGISNGVRVFTRHLDSLQQYSNIQIFSASLIVDVTLKRALSLVSSVKELPCWSFGLPFSKASQPSLVAQSSATSHVIQFTMMNIPQGILRRAMWIARSKLASWIVKYAPFLEHLHPMPQKIKTESIERFWHSAEDGLCYMFSQPRAPSSLPYSWALIYFTPLRQTGMCLATMVMCPSGPTEKKVASTITAQLCSLREHVTMKSFKVYSRYHPKHIRNRALSRGSGDQVDGHSVNGGNVPLESRGALTVSGETTSSKVAWGAEEGQKEASFSLLSSESSFLLESSPHIASGESNIAPSRGVKASSRGDNTVPPGQLKDSLSNSPGSTPQSALNAQYVSMAEQCTNKLVAMAVEGIQDGWLEVGTTKEVYVMKKLPGENGPPINSIKGTGAISAPPEFLLRLLLDPAHSTKLDELLKEVRVLERVAPAVALVQLLYKPVWPTSPRDFSVLSIRGQVDDSTWTSSAISISDPRIPLEKGFVRADLLGGGYVIRSLPNKPEMSVVTYAACVNLKGSIPAFAVNKMMESQPMCVNRLRSVAEPLYQSMISQPQKLASFEEEFPVPQVFPKRTLTPNGFASAPLDDSFSQPQHNPPLENTGDLQGSTQNGGVDSDDHKDEQHMKFETPPLDSEELHCDHAEVKVHTEEGLEVLIPSEGSLDSVFSAPRSPSVQPLASAGNMQDSVTLRQRTHSAPVSTQPLIEAMPGDSRDVQHDLLQSITRENISYPRHDSGQVDYRTLANQTAAHVLEEVFHVSNLDLLDSATYTDQATGGWIFSGYEKEVLLLTKTVPNQSFSSFMGKGIIPFSPDFIFNSLRNPQLRFMYDNMLKELHIVRNIEDGLFILHLHHETTQCFIKQARDFCILVSERSELNKKLLTAVSIETADCPLNPNLQRGKIHCSGWVIEPTSVQGKACAEVTYILQVDVRGVPNVLVNLISKRQPLAVAYLRDYLVSTSLEQSGQLQ